MNDFEGMPRSKQIKALGMSTVAFYRVLCRLDHLLDHRDQPQRPTGVERDPVRIDWSARRF